MDSFMYQTVGHDAVHLQADCAKLPLYREYITGESIDQNLNYSTTSGDETEDLYRLLKRVKEEHEDIRGVSVGAILSNYQRARVENVCVRLGLTCLAYLWQRDQKELLAEMINAGLTAIVIKAAAIGLKSVHLGKTLAELHSTLLALVIVWHLC
jgi:diphthine-ammonia ligase